MPHTRLWPGLALFQIFNLRYVPPAEYEAQYLKVHDTLVAAVGLN